MIPHVFTVVPSRPEFNLFGTMNPAKEVGGDFYDFFVLGDHLFFSAGDVSDKGVPAALLMAVTKTLLKSSAANNLSPADIFDKVNREIDANNRSMMFVTCFCAKVDYTAGELTFSNAGHNPLILIAKGLNSEDCRLAKSLFLKVMPERGFQILQGIESWRARCWYLLDPMESRIYVIQRL